MPHVRGHGGDFGAQYSQQIADTASKIRGLENTKTFQDIRSERAQDQLQSLIDRSKADPDFRNEPASLSSVLQDMPAGRADFVLRNTRPDGSLNEAAKAMLAPYADSRSEFQRELNRSIQNDPAFAEAYAERFPITNALMNLPKTILENTGVGRVMSAIGDVGRGAANMAGGLFPQGFMPGMGAEVDRFTSQLAAAPAAFKEDFTTMFGINQDDNPVKSVLREELDIKKNTSNDISPDTFMQAEDRSPGIAGVDLLGGTPISQALSGTTGVDLSRFIDPNTGRTRSDVKPQFQNLNLGQLQNLIRDESGYFDRVIQQLGLGGR